MRFRFTFVSGARAGQEVVVEKRVVRIGRDPSCDVALDPVADAAASSNHAQIMLLDNGQVLLSDLGSSNGTFIGEEKVTSAVPIATGTTITLGKDGPQVTVSIEPSAPAPAADAAPAADTAPAAPKKKSKTGCIVGLVLLFVGLPCLLGIVGVTYYFLSEPATKEAPEQPPEPEEAAAEPTPEPEPEPEAEPDRRSPWGKLADGSVIELETASKLQVAGQTMESKVTQRYTWLSRDEKEVTVRIETITAAGPTGAEQKFPLMLEEVSGETKGEQPLEEREEQVETPAGTFDATYRKMKSTAGGQETTIESWTDPDLPLPYKTITKSATTDATTVMTKLERK